MSNLKSSKPKTSKLKLPPPAIALFVAAAMGLVHYFFPLVLGYADVRQVAALLLVAVALVFLSESLLSFIRHKTTILPFNPERASTLVVSGVYKFSRNPMYLGMLILLLALMLLLGNPSLIWGPCLFVLSINVLQIKREEAALNSLFGSEYQAYCKRVRRWL